MLAMFTAAVGMYFIARHFGSVPGLGKLVLKDPGTTDESLSFLAAMADDQAPPAAVGDEGVVITPMRPAGRVEVRGRVVDAVAEFGFIDAGARVRVASVDGVRIGVEPIGGGA
jgi:membrane-bound serine protease (ClpP class)